MRLERLAVRESGGRTRRTAELAWIGGRTRMSVEVPSEYAPHDDDLSPFVPAALLLAMRRAEPLQIDGSISARLFSNLTHAQEILGSWNPTLRRVLVRAAAVDSSAEAAIRRSACSLSRGIDSTYSAAVDRPAGQELDFLVHWRDFELRYSEATRAREVELAGELADRLGLAAVIVSSDVPEALANVVDFDDATSTMLASVALSLPGLAGRFVIPSAVGYSDLMPFGQHPLLDPVWSTERVTLEHDSLIPNRDAKVAWLVAERPDLLDLIHVCLEQDSVENCGRCGKCLWTMLLLHLNGALERSSFPDRIDPEDVVKAHRPAPYQLLGLERVHERLGNSPRDLALKRAVRRALRNSTRKPTSREWLSMTSQNTRRLHFLLRGRMSDVPTGPSGTAIAEVGPLDPALPPPRDQPDGLLGLVRAVDGDERRHRYAAGLLPEGRRSGELGALLAERPEGGVPLDLSADGRPRLALLGRTRSPWRTLRWVLAPLLWRGQGSPAARVRSAARRALDTRPRRGPGRRAAGGGTTGWLHPTEGEGRVELWGAMHPVLDDILLTTDRDEALELGYLAPEPLGFLERRAPVTGVVGTASVPIPWARHWGRRR